VVVPHGNSMRPKVQSGAQVTLEPVVEATELAVGDIVLVKVRGTVYLHLVKALQGPRVQIGNNRGHVNGWTHRTKVYGRAVRIR